MMLAEQLKNLQAIIFDLDGTLADTQLNFSAMCAELSLPDGTHLLEHCATLSDTTRIQQIHTVIQQHELRGAAQASWIAGAQTMLYQLAEAEIPMAILTRNMRQAAQLTVDNLGIPISILLTREDCQPKPHPEGLLKIASDWNIAPKQIAYVGDYQFDLIAARNANMLGVLKTNADNLQFSHLADLVITDFQYLSDLLISNKNAS